MYVSHPSLSEGLSQEVAQTVATSFANAAKTTSPYVYWSASNILPETVAEALRKLPFKAPELGGVSGKRELHNATRTYIDPVNRSQFDACEAVAAAFQSRDLIHVIERTFGCYLSGTYLRMEYAQDTDGFWLEPHSDLGVKCFTLLLYLSDDPRHSELGTDIYDADKRHVGTSAFLPNTGMIFVPSDTTIHGFEQRPIAGVRKSLIVNYVTDDWRAREQLAYPNAPIGV